MDELAKLKDQILSDLLVIIDETDVAPAEKFELLLTRYTNGGESSILARAYEAAKAIEDTGEKGTALMRLLEEVNIAQAEEAPDATGQEPQQATEPAQEQEQPTEMPQEQPVQNIEPQE